MNGIEDYNFEKLEHFSGEAEGFKNIKLMNDTPPLNRGISWVFDDNI
jgi:hypothetical protein